MSVPSAAHRPESSRRRHACPTARRSSSPAHETVSATAPASLRSCDKCAPHKPHPSPHPRFEPSAQTLPGAATSSPFPFPAQPHVDSSSLLHAPYFRIPSLVAEAVTGFAAEAPRKQPISPERKLSASYTSNRPSPPAFHSPPTPSTPSPTPGRHGNSSSSPSLLPG